MSLVNHINVNNYCMTVVFCVESTKPKICFTYMNLLLHHLAQSNPVLVYPSFDKLVFQPIYSLKTLMRDTNIKYRTFICLAMSRGLLTTFLEALPKQTSECVYRGMFV